jgi:purine-nucleoside phosphorylase
MHGLAERIDTAADFVRERWNHKPVAGIILGSGLGSFVDAIQSPVTILYNDIPEFPKKGKLIGHRAEFVCGTVGDVPVITMAGRFHFYEGHSIQDVTFGVRVLRRLGAETLIVSNASGGLNPAYQSADIMVIDDHINMMFANPLIGVNDDRLGPRFPDMSAPYDPELVTLAIEIARENGFLAHKGVYASMSGPTYETRAEYRMLRRLGADVAGMSTVPEVIAARHAGMRVAALSVITNLCRPDDLGETSGQEVVDAAGTAQPRMTQIVMGLLKHLNNSDE